MPKKSKIIEFPHLRALLEQDDANRAENAAGKQASDSAPEPEGEKKSIWQELRDIELPTALQSKEVMLCTVAVLMTLTVIVLSITLLSVRLLMFLLFPVYLLYCAVSLRLDFKDGKPIVAEWLKPFSYYIPYVLFPEQDGKVFLFVRKGIIEKISYSDPT